MTPKVTTCWDIPVHIKVVDQPYICMCGDYGTGLGRTTCEDVRKCLGSIYAYAKGDSKRLPSKELLLKLYFAVTHLESSLDKYKP